MASSTEKSHPFSIKRFEIFFVFKIAAKRMFVKYG